MCISCVCMGACKCENVSICEGARVGVGVCMHACVCTKCVHLYYTCAHMCVYYTHVYMCMSVCMHMYTCVYSCVPVAMYVCAWTCYVNDSTATDSTATSSLTFVFCVQRFKDGITNKLVGCYQKPDQTDIVLVRVNGEGTETIIDREAEIRTFQLLSTAKCGPPLYAVFDNGMAYGFFHGQPLDEKIVRDEKVATWVLLSPWQPYYSISGVHFVTFPIFLNE